MITSEINAGSQCFWNYLKCNYMYNITCILNKKIVTVTHYRNSRHNFIILFMQPDNKYNPPS